MRILLVASLLLILSQSVCADPALETSRSFDHLLERMRARYHQLRVMNPLDHFHHVLGDIHVLMQAGRTYQSKFSDVDLFGAPRYHDSTMRPRYHIFNSDWDDSIEDVLITGKDIVIRTSRPVSMMRLKAQKGMIFSTAMDFSQEGDEEHRGSRDFLLTQHPTLIDDNLVLLQNVVEMEFEHLWEIASISTDVQHYQFKQSDGSMTTRSLPVTFTVFLPDEEESSSVLHKRGGLDDLWGSIKSNIATTVESVRTALFDKASIAVSTPVRKAQTVNNLMASEFSHEYSFNFNPESGKAFASVPLFPATVPATSLSESDSLAPLKLDCKDC